MTNNFEEKDHEKAVILIDAFIQWTNADHEGSITLGRNQCCYMRDEIQRLRALEAQLQQAREELAEARRKLDTFEYGENYIKKFLDAKEKCSAMYPPEEVYAPGQLECWAEEHGYKPIAPPEVKP